MWTKFYDMYSGGGQKTDYYKIFIELPEEEAISYFENRFGIDPKNTTCPCCGSDFAISTTKQTPIQGDGILIINKQDING